MSDCNCNSSSVPSQIYSFQYQYNPSCTSSSDCGTAVGNAKCITYQGVDLECSGINTNDTLEIALQKIDTIVCQTAGDYSTYNVHCLDDEEAITTEASFVDAVTGKLCTIETTVDTFINTTFPAYQTSVTEAIGQVPAITCETAGVTDEDTTSEILVKYCTKFGTIDESLDISSVTWDSCYTVASTPSTIAEGFSLLANQICLVKASSTSSVLPVFNNSTSCLSSTGLADTLVVTVNALRTRVCQSPTFNINTLTWGCLTKPSSTTTDLQSAFQTVLDTLSTLSEAAPTYSGDFVVTNVDDDDLCLGKNIALATPLNQDRFVASNSDDDDPGTLIDKLEAGDGIDLDDTTTPGKIIITSTATDVSGKVYANEDDDTLGFLDEKTEGSSGDDITITALYNPGTQKLQIAAILDRENLADALLDLILENTDLRAKFCSLLLECPAACQPPQNVQALSATTTTTSTTTLMA